jgi:proteasome lid subunit RPN8/RPN11
LSEQLVLGASVRDDIVAHARAKAPQEACGLVLVSEDGDPTVLCCTNIHPTPTTRYKIDNDEIRRVLMQYGEEKMLAIYHSHPATQAYPSPTDRAEAHYPDAFHVLVSLRDATPDLRAFRVRDGWVREVALA